jgi:molybdopterin/thiamine biosynthesis adenylyltransferase
MNFLLRNRPLFSKKEQEKLKKISFVIAGGGIGSLIVEGIARLGGERIVIADGDIVGIENLNRQSFILDDLNKNKAQIIAEKINKINSHAKIIPITHYITHQNFREFVEMGEIIIDCIDPLTNIDVSKEISKLCKIKKKIFLYPIDLGWGACLLTFFPEDSGNFEKIVGEGDCRTMCFNLVHNLNKKISFPPSFWNIVNMMLEEKLDYYPQTILTALSATVLTLSAIIKIVKNQKVPQIMYLNLLEEPHFIKENNLK